jgi:hypothetical protein
MHPADVVFAPGADVMFPADVVFVVELLVDDPIDPPEYVAFPNLTVFNIF